MKLLLHICCAPCLIYPYQVLKQENIEFEGYFFNPNIQPIWEYKRRKKTLEQFMETNPLQVRYSDPYDDLILLNALSFESKWSALNPEDRCAACYRIRLDRSAKHAADHGFEAFSTTLLGSIYQNNELIRSIGHDVASKYNIKFYDHDFRDGFRVGQNLAKEQGLFRQKFCGCICSLNQSALKDKIYSSMPRE